jgi:hypothetical protein
VGGSGRPGLLGAIGSTPVERLGPGARVATTNIDSGPKYPARGLELV